jgi:hypothetical protein
VIRGNILVVSRTPWYETPRIRHQLSRMLRDRGYEIHYLETIFGNKPMSEVREPGIQVYRAIERIHHQLRPLDLLERINTSSMKKQVNFFFSGLEFVAVFNFNYDYGFLKEMFNVPIVTIINDDFIAAAKPWMRLKVEKKLALTCQKSDSVLSVSYSLDRYLKKINNKSELFLPWAAKPYSKPALSKKREVVLYFGFISRVDTRIIDELCKKRIRIRFVGPVLGDGLKVKKKYESYENIEFLSPSPLSTVDLEDVCCSIALYDLTNPITIAITASNRMFQLLAEGIPLIYPNMPNLIHAPSTVISRCSNIEEFSEAVIFFKTNFYLVQENIELFLEDHTLERRVLFISDLLNRLNLRN